MSNSTAGLQHKIASASDLQSVVRSMKAVAASNISQYEKAVGVLDDCSHNVELGLSVCFRKNGPGRANATDKPARHRVGAVIFGSDQGLVGRFNDQIVEYALAALAQQPGEPQVWAVGERAGARLTDAGMVPVKIFPVPTAINAITPLIARILTQTEAPGVTDAAFALHLFYNRPTHGAAYTQVGQRLLPLDETWRQALADLPWPGATLPQVIGKKRAILQALVRSYLFISLFKASALSLASENASRLAAMQRADRNIDDMLQSLTGQFHQLRQSAIDAELFDVVSGFEALSR